MAPIRSTTLLIFALCPLVFGAPDYTERLDKRQNSASDLADQIRNFPDAIRDSINNGIFSPWLENVPNDGQGIRDILGDQENLRLGDVEVLALPAYANYSDGKWTAYIHGQTYTRPLNPDSMLLGRLFEGEYYDQLASSSNGDGDNAKIANVTSHLLSIPKEGEEVKIVLKVPTMQGGSAMMTTLPRRTDSRGEFDEWIQLGGSGWPRGDGSGGPVLQVQAEYGSTNAKQMEQSALYLVPSEGITILSDIDDILRETRVWEPAEALKNTIARPYRPWLSMPDIFRFWASSSSSSSSSSGSSNDGSVSGPYHFHYLTTTPQQLSPFYMDFIYSNYPPGSFTTRPMNFSNLAETLSPRETALRRILDTFPRRKFVLIGDTTNNDAVTAYGAALRDSQQVLCVLMRNTSATEDGVWIPYDTSNYEGVERERYMFFRTPEDLVGLDFEGGGCRNASVRDEVRFGWQGGPEGFGEAVRGGLGSGAGRGGVGWWAVGVVMGVAVLVGM